jgi:hypothetical protein
MEVLNRRPPRANVRLHQFRWHNNLGGHSMDATVRKQYCRPEIEDLGSLQELTAAGGPNFGVDSAAYAGGGVPVFGVS